MTTVTPPQGPGRVTGWNLPRSLRYYFSMELNAIAVEICDQADEFLAGVTRRDEAKVGIAELLTMHHAGLAPGDRKIVIDHAMRILEREGFFDRAAGGEE